MIEFFSSTASTLGVLSPLVDTVVMLFFDYIVIRFKTGVKSSIACSRRSIFGEAAQKKRKARERNQKDRNENREALSLSTFLVALNCMPETSKEFVNSTKSLKIVCKIGWRRSSTTEA